MWLQSCLETACFQNPFSQEKENSGVREEGKYLRWLRAEPPPAAVAHGAMRSAGGSEVWPPGEGVSSCPAVDPGLGLKRKGKKTC